MNYATPAPATRPAYRELHEHGVTGDELVTLVTAEAGAWYLPGAPDMFTGRPAWGYVEAATVDADRAGDAVILTLTDPMAVVAVRTVNPITGAPARVTVSRSIPEGEACPVCGDIATHPADRDSTPAPAPEAPAEAPAVDPNAAGYALYYVAMNGKPYTEFDYTAEARDARAAALTAAYDSEGVTPPAISYMDRDNGRGWTAPYRAGTPSPLAAAAPAPAEDLPEWERALMADPGPAPVTPAAHPGVDPDSVAGRVAYARERATQARYAQAAALDDAPAPAEATPAGYVTRTVRTADGTPAALTLCKRHHNPAGCTACDAPAAPAAPEPCYVCNAGPHAPVDDAYSVHTYWPMSAALAEFAAADAAGPAYDAAAAYVDEHRPY